MQTQNFSAESSREQILKKIETREVPPTQLAREMLRQGDERVTKLKSEIEDLIAEMEWEEGQEAVVAQLRLIQNELDSAHSELRRDLKSAVETPTEAATPEKAKQVEKLFFGEEAAEEGWDAPQAERSESAEMSAEDFSENLAALFNKTNFDFAVFDEFLQAAESSTERRQDIFESLSSKTTEKYAKRLMEDGEYRRELGELATSLAGRPDEEGPELLAERSLGNIIVVHEMFGKEAVTLAKKMDLKAYEPSLMRQARDTVISVYTASFDQETGELSESSIEAGYSFDYVSPSGENEDGEILRRFSRSVTVTEDGSRRIKKKVHHELMRVPESIQGNSTAARVTNECLPLYDATGIEEITLNASLEKGGYTWAAYGYGWDEEKTALTVYQEEAERQADLDFDSKQERLAEKLRSDNPGISEKELDNRLSMMRGGEKSTARRTAAAKFPELTGGRKQEMVLQRIEKMVKDSSAVFLSAAREAGVTPEEIAVINEEFEKLLQNPETTTPQKLAAVGRDKGPRLCIGEAGTWRTEKAFEEAVGRGEDAEVPQMKGSFHAGKIGLMSSNWYGKIELKPQGKQQGKNREALQKVLDKSIKKYDDKKRQAA